MSELLKIATNGQWSLEKGTSSAFGVKSAPLGVAPAKDPNAPAAPRVALYRGMNGLTAKDLKRFGVDVQPEGGVHHTKQELGLKDQGWWNDDPRWGLTYSSFDHVNKKPSKEPTYDAFMVGEADHPGGDKNITHALREKNTPVTLHRIVYHPTKGNGDERSENIRKLAPDVPWPKPKLKP